MLSLAVLLVQISLVKLIRFGKLHSLFAQCEIIRLLAPVLLGHQCLIFFHFQGNRISFAQHIFFLRFKLQLLISGIQPLATVKHKGFYQGAIQLTAYVRLSCTQTNWIPYLPSLSWILIDCSEKSEKSEFHYKQQQPQLAGLFTETGKV